MAASSSVIAGSRTATRRSERRGRLRRLDAEAVRLDVQLGRVAERRDAPNGRVDLIGPFLVARASEELQELPARILTNPAAKLCCPVRRPPRSCPPRREVPEVLRTSRGLDDGAVQRSESTNCAGVTVVSRRVRAASASSPRSPAPARRRAGCRSSIRRKDELNRQFGW